MAVAWLSTGRRKGQEDQVADGGGGGKREALKIMPGFVKTQLVFTYKWVEILCNRVALIFVVILLKFTPVWHFLNARCFSMLYI